MKLSVHNFVELSRCLKTIQNELGKDPYLGDSVPQTHFFQLIDWHSTVATFAYIQVRCLKIST